MGALTKRERDVVRLLAQGKSTMQIAAELFLTPATVYKYTYIIRAKTETHSNIELAIKASFALR